MKRMLAISMFLLAISAPFSIRAELKRPKLSDVANEVVAIVNGRAMSRDELAALSISAGGRQLLETLIAQEVVRQEAERLGVTITPEEISEYTRAQVQALLDNQARRAGAKDLQDLLAKSGEPPESIEKLRLGAEAALRPFVEPDLLTRKLMGREITVSDDQVKVEFERRYNAKVRVLQIVVPSEEQAQVVLEKLKMGADFGQLAEEISIDPVSRRTKGEIPSLSVASTLGAAAAKLNPGEIGGPIQTPDGFHIVKLVESVPAQDVTFEDAKETLRAELLERRMSDERERWLGDLIARADIKRTLQVP